MTSNHTNDASSHRLARVRFSLVCIGILFAGAALFKVHAQLTMPPIAHTWAYSRLMQIGLIAFEFAFAGWLISTPHILSASRVTRVLLVMFFAYSLWRFMQGAESCGCFGRVRAHPLWTMALDALLFSWLAFISPKSTLAVPSGEAAPWNYIIHGIAAIMTVPLTWLAIFGVTVAREPLSARPGEMVVLDPHSWVGQKCPIVDYIETASDVAEKLRHGETLIVLIRHDCQTCEEMVPRYRTLAAQDERRIVLIEVPPVGDSLSAVADGKLSTKMEWFVQTPTEILLKDGIVVQASHGGHALGTGNERLLSASRL